MIRPVSVDEHDIFHLAAFSYRSFGNCYPILQINRGINVGHLKKKWYWMDSAFIYFASRLYEP